MRLRKRGRTSPKKEDCLIAYDTRHDPNTLSLYTMLPRKAPADIPFILTPKRPARNGKRHSHKQFPFTRPNRMPTRYVVSHTEKDGPSDHGQQWFAPNKIDDAVFRMRSSRVPPTSTELFTGAVSSAATFGEHSPLFPCILRLTRLKVSGGKNYLIVGSEGGVYVCMRGELSTYPSESSDHSC